MKTLALFIAGTLLATAATAADDVRSSRSSIAESHRSADTNGDGLLTRDEYMKHAEKMWTSMPKNTKGLVDLATVDGDAAATRSSMGKDATDSRGTTGSQDSRTSPGTSSYPSSESAPRATPKGSADKDSMTPGSMGSADKGVPAAPDSTRR